jgi:hypothetical protein
MDSFSGVRSADDAAGIGQRQEPRLVQALVPESTVEALDACVLDRLAGRDEAKADSMDVRPLVQGLPDELWAVIEYELVKPVEVRSLGDFENCDS